MTTKSNIQSGIRDNFLRGRMGEYLKDKIKPDADLSFVSAYFTIYAYDAIKTQLESAKKLRFLFGEPRFINTLDPDKTDKKAFNIEDNGLALDNRLEQKRIARECSEWIREKVEIRSVMSSSLLHGKMYHIDNNGVEEAIVGSSNFTVHGLGEGNANDNIELNLEVDGRRDRDDLKKWFNEIWANQEITEDVKEDVLKYLAQLYQNNSPEFIYFKTLYHLFDEYLEQQKQDPLADKKSLIVESQVWNKLFEFQKDGVKGAVNKLLNYNGCILADAVGLGKTYEALAIIKYFELQNFRVLVLCPKKLRENWTVYQASVGSLLNPFPKDRFSYTVLSHTDLSRTSGFSGDIDLANFNWGNYDLVVIDESHNFRNNTKGKRDENNQPITISRYERLLNQILIGNVHSKVLLLSATPVNNSLKDLKNQIYLLTEGEDWAFARSLGIASIESLLTGAQKTFQIWAENTKNRDTQELMKKLSPGFFKLLDSLTIARSRRHIVAFYPQVVEELGGFPKREKPAAFTPEIDREGEFPSYDSINDQILKYKLSLYNPARYVKPEFRKKYELDKVENFNQEQREKFLIGMMKVNFLKRLESSIFSFKTTMQRTLEKIEDLENRIARFKEYANENPALDPEDMEIDAREDEELRDAFEVGKKLIYQMTDLDLDAWLKDLKEDQANIESLHECAKNVSRDRDLKFIQLKELIKGKLENPTQNKTGKANKKLLIFTAFADTAQYLYDGLRAWASDEMGAHIALVTGGSYENKTTLGRKDYPQILTNFSPISKERDKQHEMPQKEEIDILIATDCISEGQNLQDCDLLVNFDIHWNPVRVIQRFGRIDRIGSQSTAVRMVNFWPTPNLDKYIALKSRVEARMALVDATASAAGNLLTMEQVNEAQKIEEVEMSYRDQQLLRMKDEVLDLEDFNESVSLNEFTLDDFRVELSRYIESNRKALEQAQLGLYAATTCDPGASEARPGVIFCLRQRGSIAGNQAVNPLSPYYLVYVMEGKTVLQTFTQPKQILEILRGVSAGKKAPLQELCERFDAETSNGQYMTVYNEMLSTGLKATIEVYKRILFRIIGQDKSGILPDVTVQLGENTQFDLITWMVIYEQ